eukprot:1161618-Pelagomonas_calceolata.AAC.7
MIGDVLCKSRASCCITLGVAKTALWLLQGYPAADECAGSKHWHLWALECLNTCKCVSALARVSVEDQGTVTMEGKERKVMTMQTKATAMDRLGYVRKVTAMDGLGCVHVQKGTAMDGLDYMCISSHGWAWLRMCVKCVCIDDSSHGWAWLRMCMKCACIDDNSHGWAWLRMCMKCVCVDDNSHGWAWLRTCVKCTRTEALMCTCGALRSQPARPASWACSVCLPVQSSRHQPDVHNKKRQYRRYTAESADGSHLMHTVKYQHSRHYTAESAEGSHLTHTAKDQHSRHYAAGSAVGSYLT